MTIELSTFLAIVAMACATILTRVSGPLILRSLNLSDEAKSVLDAIPPAVLMAVIAPTAFATGWAETIACLVTALTARRLPMLACIALGVATVALLRAMGF